MKFKKLLGLLLAFTTIAQGAHVNDSALYLTDVKDAYGNSVFKFPTAAPAASRACVTNADGELTSSSVLASEVGALSGIDSNIQDQLDGKQASGNYLTALTGDVTASGPGSATATLANTAVTPGSYTNANITVDAKGRVTSAANGSPGGVTSVSASSPLSSSGGSTPTITIQNAAADGSTKGAASFNASDFDASSGNISIDYANGQAASGSAKGFLSSSDWTTFNNKAGLGANSFTDTQTITKNSLGTTRTDGLVLQNTTAATSGNQQISPSLRLSGKGWKTNSTAASQTVDWNLDVLPVQGSANPRSYLRLRPQTNGGGFTDVLELQSGFQDGASQHKAKVYGLTEIYLDGNNNQPGTLDHLTLNNPSSSGSTHQTNLFNGVQKSAWTYNSFGGIKAWMLSAGTFEFDFASSLPGSPTFVHQIFPGGFYSSGGVYASQQITAGSADTSPNATLSTYGSFSSKGEVKTADFTINDTAKMYYCDASSSSNCGGTPSNSCASYTGSGQGTCETHTAVGCSWFAGNSCGGFSGDIGSCQGQSGCTADENSCSGATNTDQFSCESQDDSYGGSCSWDTSTCSSQSTTAACSAVTGCTAHEDNVCASSFFDTASCNGQTGCTAQVDTDCAPLSDGGGDGTLCATQPECSYESGSGACTGSYFTTCNGNYFSSCSGNLCGGNYYTGNCSGTYGAACQGTASCGNLSTGSCTSETGCSVVSGILATLPSVATHLNTSDGKTGFEVGIKNIGTTGNVTVQVASGTSDTFEDGSTSYVIAPAPTNSPKPYVELHPLKRQASCSDFENNSSGCNSHGCLFTPPTCGSFDEAGCGGASGCSWTGSSCEGTYAGTDGSCSGNYDLFKRWMIWGQKP